MENVTYFKSENADHNRQKKQMRIPHRQVTGESKQDHVVFCSSATCKTSLAVSKVFHWVEQERIGDNPVL